MGCFPLGPLGRQDHAWTEVAEVLELGLGLLQGKRPRPKLVGLLLETQVGMTPPGGLGRWCWQQKQYRAVAKHTQRWVVSRSVAGTTVGILVTWTWVCLLKTALLGLELQQGFANLLQRGSFILPFYWHHS